jgi:hypothetical protein
MMQAKWYVNVNDLIGGYSIGTAEGPASENRQYGDIADFMTEEHAIEIVQLHEEVNYLVTIRDLTAKLATAEQGFTDLVETSARRLSEKMGKGLAERDTAHKKEVILHCANKLKSQEIDDLKKVLLPFAAAIRGLDIDESERSEIVVEFGLYQLTFQHFYDALTTFQTYDSTGRLDQEPIDNSAIGLIIKREEGTTDGDDQPPQTSDNAQGKIRYLRKDQPTRPRGI